MSTKKLTIISICIALNTVLSSVIRIEGMAPMSTVFNIIFATFGTFYVTLIALVTAVLRMFIFNIPPLAITGALFGAILAGLCYKFTKSIFGAWFGEFVGTGIIGSIVSVPIMQFFMDLDSNAVWFLYTPRFVGATIIGGIIAVLIYSRLKHSRVFKDIQQLFDKSPNENPTIRKS